MNYESQTVNAVAKPNNLSAKILLFPFQTHFSYVTMQLSNFCNYSTM